VCQRKYSFQIVSCYTKDKVVSSQVKYILHDLALVTGNVNILTCLRLGKETFRSASVSERKSFHLSLPGKTNYSVSFMERKHFDLCQGKQTFRCAYQRKQTVLSACQGKDIPVREGNISICLCQRKETLLCQGKGNLSVTAREKKH